MTSTEHQRDEHDEHGDEHDDDLVLSSQRTVKAALFEYRDAETGARRIAVRGDVVELSDIDVRRGERAGALVDDDEDEAIDPFAGPVVAPRTPDQPEPAGVSPLERPEGAVAPTNAPATPSGEIGPVDPAAQPAGTQQGGQQEGSTERPKMAESVAKWREYAVARGEEPDTADDMTKDQLIEKYGKS